MKINEFLSSIYRLGIVIEVEQDKLKIIAPIDALSPEIQNQLRERKTEIIKFLHDEHAIDYMTVPMGRVDRSQPIPVSFAQQRLWLQYKLEGKSNTYNEHYAYRLKGELDITALEKSLRYLIARHDALRTSFKAIDGEPYQVISESLEWKLDMREAEGETAERELLALSGQPFSLEQAPLMRAYLWKQSHSKYTLLFNIHHIIFDGSSQGIFERELEQVYSQYVEGQDASLPPLELDYADYAAWQRDWLQGEELQRQLAYWQENLKGAPELLELPTDHPRSPVRTYHGRTAHLDLEPALVDRLQELARSESVTLFMLLNAAYAVLLGRYSRQEDLVIGFPVANRQRMELESMLGFFVNMLPLRVDLSGNPGISELLQRIRQGSLDAYAHQDLPFEKMVAELHPRRDLQFSPIFQVAFVLENAPSQGLRLKECAVTPEYVEIGVARYDLLLQAQKQGKRLHLELEYDLDLFEPATAERMLAHYNHILEWMVSSPNKGIFEFDLLNEAERQQILVEWNNTATDYPRGKCIHQLFEEQAERTPDAPAIVFIDQVLTYRQLNSRANQLSHSLCMMGTGPESRVGMYIERSSEMIISLLAILKAGGAYVPMDMAFPLERQAFILRDSKSLILLTLQRHLPDLPAFNGKVICVDDEAIYTGKSEKNPCVSMTPENLAYIMYTSGSTGLPKGTCIPHRAVARLVKNTNYASFSREEVFLQFAPFAFDASTFEIWGSLLNGAKLVIFPPHLPSLKELHRFVETTGVNTLWLTAGLFHQMMESQPGIVNSLRQLLSGGDVLSPAHVRMALQQNPNCRLINGYGPTENTTFTCCYTIKELNAERSVPIGRPIANTSVYILDIYRQPVPVGLVGELYTGGDGLAREYLNQPELTEQKFVPDPFSDKPGPRLYRTGDFVRWLPDGNIEFLGRMDNQVKLRGYRIELSEVETVIGQYPEVRQALVLVREDQPGDKRLVAYLIPVSKGTLDAEELRGFLREKLPDYMIPSAIVLMDSFPLTINGKVDRKALPMPQMGAMENQEYIAPRNQTELILSKIWMNVLGMSRVSMGDNFFDVGGNSLSAIRVMAHILDEFGIVVSVKRIFEFPRLSELAKYINFGLLSQGQNSASKEGTSENEEFVL